MTAEPTAAVATVAVAVLVATTVLRQPPPDAEEALVLRMDWQAEEQTQELASWVESHRPRQPVVLRGTFASRWWAVGRWDPSYLSEHVGGRFPVTVNSEPLMPYIDREMAGWALPAIERCSQARKQQQLPRSGSRCEAPLPLEKQDLSMAEFWRRTALANEAVAAAEAAGVQGPPRDVEWLYGAIHLQPDFEPELLRADLRGFRTWMAPASVPREARRWHLWYSGKGPTKQGHYDQTHNLYTQLYGRRKVTLSPPAAALEAAHLFPRVHGSKRHSMIEAGGPGVRPQLGRTFDLLFGTTDRNGSSGVPPPLPLRSVEVVLEPGQVLYIPPWWLHRVESLDNASVALSSWWPASEEKVLIEELRAGAVLPWWNAASPAESGHGDTSGGGTGVAAGVRTEADVAASTTGGRAEDEYALLRSRPPPEATTAKDHLQPDGRWPGGLVVAVIKGFLDATIGASAMRRLITQRYQPFFGNWSLGEEPFASSCRSATRAEALASQLTAEQHAQLAELARKQNAIAARFEDAAIRELVLADEAELLIGSELGAASIQPLLLHCWGVGADSSDDST